MRTRTCLLFQLHDILYRGSYPGLYSFQCYPFMTAPARLATDVCNPSPAEINCFTTSPSFLDQTTVQPLMQAFLNLGKKLLQKVALAYISLHYMGLGTGPDVLKLQATLHVGISKLQREAAVQILSHFNMAEIRERVPFDPIILDLISLSFFTLS